MTFYWYDLETFGRHPQYDRIAQFAGVRTDAELKPIEEPLVLYCRITDDYLPDPAACLVTGITPQVTRERGMPEYEFISRIHRELMRPNTCTVGYNSIRFDDEFVRSCLYRNFFDPYEREYAGGNSRWDLSNVVRAMHDLRPDGMRWPRNEHERPDFRLERLAEANDLTHENAHDALSDVYATIGLARLIQAAQPKLFSFFFRRRKRAEVAKVIDLHRREPFLHTSSLYTRERGCTTVLAPLTVDPNNPNAVLCYDLRYDPELLLSAPVELVRERLFTPNEAMQEDEERIHITSVALNKCPVVAPLSVLDDVAAERLQIDLAAAEARRARLLSEPLLTQKVTSAFSGRVFEDPKDPDLQIYSGGFFQDADRERFAEIHAAADAAAAGEFGPLQSLRPSFEDPRIPEMLWRFIGRNYPESFNSEQRKRWLSFCAGRILFPPSGAGIDLAEFEKKCRKFAQDKNMPPARKATVHALSQWAARLRTTVLEYSPQ